MFETQWRHWLSRIPMNHFTNVRRSSGRRGNRPGLVRPALLQCQTESLEARLLLSVTAPASATVIENGSLAFSPTSNNSITVSGIVGLRGRSAPSPSLSLSVSHGTLTLGSTTGLTFTSGSNGTRSLTVSGSETSLNAALNGLTYAPATGYTGDDSLVINFHALAASSATVSLFVDNWSQLTDSSFTQLQGLAGATQAFDVTLQLSNGDLMLHSAGVSANWFELAPDNAGSYADGTWTQLAPMHVARLYFSSDVLPNGDVFVLGGEYASDGTVTINPQNGPQYSDSAEIFTPPSAANPQGSWAMAAPYPVIYRGLTFPNYQFPVNVALAGDQPSEVLPNGDVLVGNIFNSGTQIYDPATNQWLPGPQKVHSDDESSEETWVKLANGDILTYDIWSSITDGQAEAELYEPPSASNPAGQWVDASSGHLHILSTNATGDELGPALIGVRGGDPMFFGANGMTEIYDTTTNSWVKGPRLPSVLLPGPDDTMVETQLTMGDAPAAVLPNGDDLLALSPSVYIDNAGNEQFPSPTFIYEYDPVNHVFTNVSPPNYVSNQGNINSYLDSMLVLPTGQILLTSAPSMYSAGSVAFYNLAPGDGPDPSWAPTITSFTLNSNGSYTLKGTQLNGRDEGAAYGDDEQMAENYPLVRLTSATGVVSYATTSNWSSTGVATGNTSETVNVVMPSMPGVYSVVVIADGIASQPIVQVIGHPQRRPNVVVSGSAVNPSDVGKLAGVGVLAPLVAIDNSSPAVAPTLSVMNSPSMQPSAPELNLDFSSNNPTWGTISPPASRTAYLDAGLNDADSVHWAALNAALDILSA